MVKGVENTSFYLREIDHHAVAVQLARTAFHSHFPVVAVQIGALARVIECQSVRGAEFKCFTDKIHVVVVLVDLR